MTAESVTVLTMASPATYQISVKGKVSENWAGWFNTTEIQYCEGSLPHTQITCTVKDQAELMGILNRLNGLSLPLLRVIFIEKEAEEDVADE